MLTQLNAQENLKRKVPSNNIRPPAKIQASRYPKKILQKL